MKYPESLGLRLPAGTIGALGETLPREITVPEHVRGLVLRDLAERLSAAEPKPKARARS